MPGERGKPLALFIYGKPGKIFMDSEKLPCVRYCL